MDQWVIHVEDQGEDPEQGIHAHLGQQAGEQCGHRHLGGVIGGGQPEEEGERRGLDAEGHHEHGPGGLLEGSVLQGGQADRKVCHIECAGLTINKSDGRKENDRTEEVHGDIFNGSVQLVPISPEYNEDKRRDEQYFKPDIEIKEIPRKEGPIHTGYQHKVEEKVAVAQAPCLDRDRREYGEEDGNDPRH